MGYWETVRALNTLELGHKVLVGDWLPTFVGPAAVRARIDETNARYQSLGEAFSQSAVSPTLRASWDQLKLSWDGFVRNNRDSWWALTFEAKALSEELDRYDENYRAMYEALKREQSAQGQPAPSAVAPPSPNPHSSAGQPSGSIGNFVTSIGSSPVAVGVVAVIGLFAAGYLIKAVKS